MQTSDSIAALGTALAKAQADLEGATKDATNPHFKSKYATLASVWEAWKAVGPKNGLSVIQGCTSDGPAVTVMTRLVHSSGEWVESGLTLVARDASPQSIVAACTYGRRAGLSGMVGIAPEDDDGESAQPARTQAVASGTSDSYAAFVATLEAAARQGGHESLRAALAGHATHPLRHRLRQDAETQARLTRAANAANVQVTHEAVPE